MIASGTSMIEVAKDLKEKVSDMDVEILSGMDGLLDVVTMEEADTVVTAIVGMIGIRPTIAAIESGKAEAEKRELYITHKVIARQSEDIEWFARLSALGKDKLR